MCRALPVLLILASLLCACSNPPSADYVSLYGGDHQALHFRPVHTTQSDWSIEKLAGTLTLRSDQPTMKASARSHAKNVVVREGGTVRATIVASDDGARLESNDPHQKLELRCRANRTAELVSYDKIYHIVPTPTGLRAESFEIRKLQRNHRFSVIEHPHPSGACDGVELELPFSEMGALIFQFESIPLPERFGLSWFVTKFNVDCNL